MKRLVLVGALGLAQCGNGSSPVAPDSGTTTDSGVADTAQPKLPIEGAQKGDPELGSAQQITFGPTGCS